MKNQKIYIFTTLFVFVFTFIIYQSFDKKSYAATVIDDGVAEQQKYYFIRRNMLSHHYITSNYDPSGTIMIKTGSTTSVTGESVLTYCAHKGKYIAKSRDNKYYVNVPISETSVSKIKKAEDNLTGVMLNSYPYISLAELKSKIKSSLGEEEYNKYEFDTLDVQEAMTATQAAIWNAIDNTTSNQYRTTSKIGKIKYANFHKGTSNSTWAINWDTTSAYNITSGCYKGIGSSLDCGSKSTYLAPGDTAETAGNYKKKGTTNLKERINRLIKWYGTLTKANTTSTASIPTFYVVDDTSSSEKYNWSNEGKTLTLTIKANNNDFTYNESNYKITFTDLDGNNLTNYTNTPVYSVTDATKIIGYTYVINDINTQGINANITASISSSAGNVYIYEANTSYKNTQYLIGVEEGSVPVNKNIQIFNDSKGIVKIYKTNSKDATTGVYYNDSYTNVCGSKSNSKCLSDASFVIYAADQKTIIKEFMTGTDVSQIELPLGTYYIEEIDPPVGYELNSEKLKITIENDNTIVSVVLRNDPNKICIKKVSTTDSNTTIDGAKFSVESMLGAVYEEFTSSSQEPVHCLEAQLPSGYYYIVETEAPANYFKTNVRYKVRVGNFNEDDIAEEVEYEDFEVVELELVNDTAIIENKPGIAISKTDLATGVCVPGATLVIYDKSGKEIDKWISSCEEGKDTHSINLDPGTYTLTETIAPSGYATSETIEFTINEDGSASTSLDMKDDPIDVCILKTAKGVKGGLAGAEFEIYKENGELYDKFTSGTSCTSFAYMPVGNYIIKEIKAPDGYQITNEEVKITVKDTSETQVFEIENEVETPKTAMDYSKYILIIASIFMVFGLGLVGYYGYKKQN